MITPKKLRIIKAIAIGIAIVLVLYIGLSVYGSEAAMEIPRLLLNNSLASVGIFNYEDVSFPSCGDHIVLRGWYLPGKKDSVVIIVHGGFQNRLDDNVDTLGLAHDLVKKGYNLLLFDLRGRGDSEGKGLALSNIERDIGGAVDYLKARGYPLKRIYIIGFCSGAASACIYASQNSIGALVLDGCFANVRHMFIRQAELRGIPDFLVGFFVPGVSLMTKVIYGYDIVNPEDVIPKVNSPILFIHEENDDLISWEEMHRLFEASSNPLNEFWEVSGALHSQSYKSHPLNYIEKVDRFLFTKIEDTLSE